MQTRTCLCMLEFKPFFSLTGHYIAIVESFLHMPMIRLQNLGNVVEFHNIKSRHSITRSCSCLSGPLHHRNDFKTFVYRIRDFQTRCTTCARSSSFQRPMERRLPTVPRPSARYARSQSVTSNQLSNTYIVASC